MSSDEYSDLLREKTFCEFCEYFSTVRIKEEIYLRSESLREAYRSFRKISFIENFSICCFCWSPFAWFLAYENPFIIEYFRCIFFCLGYFACSSSSLHFTFFFYTSHTIDSNNTISFFSFCFNEIIIGSECISFSFLGLHNLWRRIRSYDIFYSSKCKLSGNF